MFQKRVAEMRLYVRLSLLLHKFTQFRIASMAIVYVAFPPLIYAVPSGGASHIQFPIIGIGNYVHALLTGFEDGGAWLDPRFPIGGAKMYKKCRSECTFLDENVCFVRCRT